MVVLATVTSRASTRCWWSIELVLESQAVSPKPECKAKREVLSPRAFPFAFTYDPSFSAFTYLPTTFNGSALNSRSTMALSASRPIPHAEPALSYFNLDPGSV